MRTVAARLAFVRARQVLEFLGVGAVDEERLACATQLADHPLVHRPPANFTVHDAFHAFPDQACVILRTIEQHDQGRLIMRLLGYGNSIKPPKSCPEAGGGELFTCTDMLTAEYGGAQACKLGASTPEPRGRGGGGGGGSGGGGGGGPLDRITRSTTISFAKPDKAAADRAADARKRFEAAQLGGTA